MAIQAIGPRPSLARRAAQPVGGGLFDPQPRGPLEQLFGPPQRGPFDGLFGPPQRGPFGGLFDPPQRGPLDGIQRQFDGFGRDMRQAGRKFDRAITGEPEFNLWRIGSWGAGAWAAYEFIGSSMRNRPEGLMALALIGAGAFVGNWIYDYVRDRM